MEAVTAIVRNLLQNTRVSLIVGVVLGLLLGLIMGWGIWPVQWTDGTPEVLRQDLQNDYLRMAIESFDRTGDVDTAVRRWDDLGEAAGATFIRVQADPGYVNPVDVQEYGLLIQSVKGPISATPPSATSGTGRLVLYASVLVVAVLLAVGGLYLWRLLRKGSGTVTAVMQAAEASRQAEKTDFQSLGLAPPITQTMTTYVLGDDLYDESFSIDTGGGEFLGEYGVGVSETIGVGEPKKVAALEIWLFDKNDIKTATKVLMSEHAYNDPNIRARLEPKGELVVVKPQEQVLLETATLQLLATVVDMDYGSGAMPQKSYFERITLELAIWPRSGQ
ncbi:MAG: hypothetical protein L0287_23480 [Anaerolineae bacterium]|nr:hypothetical protein [Anaerolineae bacterium]MCI0610469.1 hypothetical protein [Anaerolineae bacterium]